MLIAIHLFSSLYFVWKNGIASYPFVLFQACVNPWNKNFNPSMSEVMPIGKSTSAAPIKSWTLAKRDKYQSTYNSSLGRDFHT